VSYPSALTKGRSYPKGTLVVYDPTYEQHWPLTPRKCYLGFVLQPPSSPWHEDRHTIEVFHDVPGVCNRHDGSGSPPLRVRTVYTFRVHSPDDFLMFRHARKSDMVMRAALAGEISDAAYDDPEQDLRDIIKRSIDAPRILEAVIKLGLTTHQN